MKKWVIWKLTTRGGVRRIEQKIYVLEERLDVLRNKHLKDEVRLYKMFIKKYELKDKFEEWRKVNE